MERIFLFLFCCIFAIRAQKIGPCSMGTTPTSSKMRCTSNGYFELTQCFDSYCVCVDPKTGEEVLSTKTQSNKIAPRCGECHIKQSSQVAKNIDSNQPQCDPKTGNYQAKQCISDNSCWCVDTQTGIRQHGDIKKNSELNCGEKPELSFSIDSPSDLSDKTLQGNDDKEDYPVADPVCKLPKSTGQTCHNNFPKVQWYFDTDIADCLAFRYNGCGGNGNRYESISDCWAKCQLADMGGCAGRKKAARNSKGDMIICNGPMSNETCPTGYKCRMQAFFAICCHEKTEDIYQKNYSPECANGKQPSKITAGGLTMNLLGKSCNDNFCPTSTICHMLEVLAHCCPS